MKKYTISAFLLLLFLAGITHVVKGQLLLEENFNYPAGDLITAHGWTAHSGAGSQAITVSTAGLSYTGYVSSGIGNAALVDNTGEDDHRTFALQSSGVVYTAFMVNVTTTSAGYFVNLGSDPIGTTYRGRVFVDATNHFGISVGSNTGTFAASTFTNGTTYLLVLKYEIVAGTNNDLVSLFVFESGLPSSEPAVPTVGPLSDASMTDITPGSVALRQYSSSQNFLVDGIRVGLTWADVLPSAIVAPTVQAQNITFSNVATTSMDVSWTIGNGSKRIAVINTSNSFTNPADGIDPVANSAYSGAGEQVVYNGNGSSVTVSGLSGGTTYWYRIYEYNGSGISTKYLTVSAPLNPNSQVTQNVVTPPVVGSPAVSSVTSSSAVLGGTITSNGGAAITERGTLWGTAPGVTIGDNKLPEGGTATGPFSHLRSPLPLKTKIHFKAYATNSAGSGLSAESSFYTLAAEPLNHLSFFNPTGATNSSITLTWSGLSVGADGYLILQKTGAPPPVSVPADGTGYVVGETIGDATVAATVFPGTALSQVVSGLASGTQYSFTIFPFAWDGTNGETCNYLTAPFAPTASASTTGSASAVYTWSGPDNGAWTTASNWTPARSTPAPGDILQFNDGSTKTVTSVPTQSFARMVLANNTTVNLQSSGVVTLSLTGSAGADLEIPAGCSLNLNAVNAITIAVATTATASVSGTLKFTATATTAHRLTGADPGSIQFNSGSTFIAGPFFSGNPFGTSSLNSVVFNSGSTYLQQAGSNPFGAGQPNSVVVFQHGSLFKVTANLVPSFSGRVYADFEMDAPGITLSPSGTSPVSIDNLTITSGTFNFNMTGPASGQHKIRENITVNAGAILNFAPSSAATISLAGVAQLITVNGTLNTNANTTFDLVNGTEVTLNSSLSLAGNLKLTQGLMILGDNGLTLSATSALTGTPSPSAMIVPTGTGQFARLVPTGFTGALLFPVGDNTGIAEYSPVSLNVTAGTFGSGSKFGVNLANAKFPLDPNNVNYLNRYWNLSATGVTGFAGSAEFEYTPADVNGNENQMFTMQVIPTPFTDFGLVNAGVHKLVVNGLTVFGTFTGSQPRPSVITTAANLIGATTATLNGEVIANYLPSDISFEYGTTTSYGTVVQGMPATVNGGGTNTALANITSLVQNTTYHFRILATNLQGTSYGNDMTFTTLCPAPGAGTTMTGPQQVCPGGSGYIYSAAPIQYATSYNWTLPPGATITSGAGTSTITVSFSVSAVSGNITIAGTSACGNGTPSPGYAITIAPTPVPAVTGPAVACINSTGNVYSTEAGMTGYSWNISPGGVITSGNLTNTISVQWSGTGPQQVSVSYTNAAGCQAATPTVYAVNVTQLPVPGITGPAVVCANAAGITYTTEPGMINYNWAVSIGGTILNGAGTNTITVLWPYPGQRSVSVTYATPAGCLSSSPTIYPVTVNPAAVPVIGSTNSPCVGSVNNQYITASGMTNYQWNVSPGGIITSGQGTPVINVTWNVVGNQWVSLGYTNTFGCTSVTPTVYNLFVNPLPSPAGAVTGTSALCAGATGVAYSCAEIINATSYDWILPAGATIATGAGTNTITVNFGTATISGNITVAGRNECGTGTPSPVFPVTVSPLPAPAGPVSGPAMSCTGATATYQVAPLANATGYAWTIPAGSTIVSGNNTNQIAILYGSSPVVGTVKVNGTNGCGNGAPSPGLTVVVNPTPPVPVVTANGNILTSSSPAGNQWYYNGNAIPGATTPAYTVTNNTGYYWCIVSLNGCTSEISNKVYITVTDVIETESAAVNIFPVPNGGKFSVEITGISTEGAIVEVYNPIGACIHVSKARSGESGQIAGIDLGVASNGLYTVIVKYGSNRLVRKIVVNR